METEERCTEKEAWRTSKNQGFKLTILPLRIQLPNEKGIEKNESRRADKSGKNA